MSLMVGGHSWWGGGGSGGGSNAGKSAVQLLQESKSQYVKSDHVLGTSQRPARPDRFHISSNPNIFLNAPAHTLHATRLSPDPSRRSTNTTVAEETSPTNITNGTNSSATAKTTCPPTIATLTPLALAQHTNAINKSLGGSGPVRIQRGAPRPRAKTQPIADAFARGGDLRRSLSHGPADRGGGGEDIQMKLRKLLDIAGSKEKIFPESPSKKSTVLANNSGVLSGTGLFRAEPVKVTVHKSLPELWKTTTVPSSKDECKLTETNNKEDRRPSCPSALSMERKPLIKSNIIKPRTAATKSPPPVPPRKSREPFRPLPQLPKEPPLLPKRITPPPPPPRILPRNNKITIMPPSRDADIPDSPPIVVDACRRSSDSDASLAGGSEDMRRRPILRSKSDVTHERCNLSQKDDEETSSKTSLNGETLEIFFNSMGLDGTTYQEVVSSPVEEEEESSPLYFDDKSSEDSIPRRCSSDDESPKQQQQQASLRPGEPSIVEKNARIIKWLFTCQRAQGCLNQRTSTKSS